ncbi:MAG: DUF169 domain-containing protein [Deltaproteobacteria bacterium]|nr:DUF169 domain-containing protein [Deltaproteobacteria bacterium]
MTDLEEMHGQARELEHLLQLQSLPLALKMLKSEDEIPEDAQRPVKDMGFHLNFCQALALSRRNGLTIAQSMQDMWCFEPVVGFGFVKPPKRFLEGHNRYPVSARTLEAGSTWARNMPRFEHGEYWGVLTSPLEKASFDPDIDIRPVLSSHAACVYYVIPPIKDRNWHMSIPCGGDLRRAACEDYNMVFSAPMEVLSDLLMGLRAMKEGDFGLPLHLTPSIEYPLQESYIQIAQSIDMHWVK